jgi:branched-chain amino acid transport system permease protein
MTLLNNLIQSPLKRDVLFAIVLICFAVLGYYLFPSNLALLTRIIAIALLVLSLDLVTGYCGVATLGHAALFGAGAYGAGIAAAHFGVTDPFLMLVIGILVGGLAGFISSLVILRAHGLPQLVLSIAIVYLAHEAANKLSGWTGGSDGLAGINPDPLFGIYAFDLWGRTAYLFSAAVLIVIFMLLRQLVRSPFGMLCNAIRQDATRVDAMGGNVQSTLRMMYFLSGMVAGAGGALNAITTQVVGLDSLSFTLSAESLVMLVVGGTGSLTGALIGAVSFMYIEDVIAAANPFHWLIIVGLLLIATVLFAPKGLYGSIAHYMRNRTRSS